MANMKRVLNHGCKHLQPHPPPTGGNDPHILAVAGDRVVYDHVILGRTTRKGHIDRCRALKLPIGEVWPQQREDDLEASAANAFNGLPSVDYAVTQTSRVSPTRFVRAAPRKRI